MKDLDYFTSQLKLKGYSVEAMASYPEAESRREQGGFDLVILSYGRAVLDARRLMRQILERYRHAPVVVITRHVEIENYIEAMQLGAAVNRASESANGMSDCVQTGERY